MTKANLKFMLLIMVGMTKAQDAKESRLLVNQSNWDTCDATMQQLQKFSVLRMTYLLFRYLWKSL